MRGLFVGRFQPLHLGHVEVFRWLMGRVDELVVAIGSANKSLSFRNPFTVGERLEMVYKVLRSLGATFMVCTVPDTGEESAVWFSYVKEHCPRFDVAYSNEEFTRLCLEHGGVRVESTPMFNREVYSGTRVRTLMAQGNREWRLLVPGEVLDFLDSIGAEERVKRLWVIYKGSSVHWAI